MDSVELTVANRSVLGKKVKALRRGGVTPANVYGHRIESQAVQVDSLTLVHTLKVLERNAILSLRIEGEKAARPVIVREIRRDILNDKILHVDFYQVSLAEKMKADVPLVLIGKSPAVEDLGGILLQGLDSIAVEALPADIPPHFEVDISSPNDVRLVGPRPRPRRRPEGPRPHRRRLRDHQRRAAAEGRRGRPRPKERPPPRPRRRSGSRRSRPNRPATPENNWRRLAAGEALFRVLR